MKIDEPKKIYLKDYTVPDFQIDQVDLFFDLHEDFCRVKSSLKIKRNPLGNPSADLILDGSEHLALESVYLNGRLLASHEYSLAKDALNIPQLPNEFGLELIVKIKPQLNTALQGLYKSGPMFCTQCEAQGFRNITYFLDRPDVMSSYTVTIEADKAKYPLLLSNGDLIEKKNLNASPTGERHQVTWHDPFKKPCYLFALVAGDLGVIHDTFTTMSGKKVNLEVYAIHGQQERCRHALDSLKKAMKWDEDRFGREYDLSTYMIVATDDFNAGAMENKGLNIFNTKLVLADSKSATDLDYFNIESVVGHEYFHNWTGNRVTLRDWFHLSLKEGLTVFRDQEFSMDMSSRSVVRINSVTDLRRKQFPEDAGPNAHPIRPESCYAVDNFYTPTIYEKGSEIIRMMQTMVGRPGFRKGMDLYFKRHDGQAVIIEDFAKAISDANKQDWNQFKLWYSQAGTPHVLVQEDYDEKNKKYELTLEQSSPQHPDSKSLHIPLVVGLLGSDGKDISLNDSVATKNTEEQFLIHLKEKKQTFTFQNISNKPVLSLNRQFSAPIYLDWKAKDEDLLFLLSHDSDDFNRWESGQKLAIQNLLTLIEANKNHKPLIASTALLEGYAKALSSNLDHAMKALILELPEDLYLAQLLKELDTSGLFIARKTLESAIASQLKNEFKSFYADLHGKNLTSRDPKDFATRSLKNLAMRYLSLLKGGDELAYKQFCEAKIMTDQQEALHALSNLDSEKRKQAFSEFHSQWKQDFLVMNKWFMLQAQSQLPDTFDQVVNLWDHADFNKKNPNRIYSLLSRFGDNLVRFHDPAQDTYAFMSDRIIEIDKYNPQVATRVAGCFNLWSKLPSTQKQKAHTALEKMIRAGLSKNTYEIVSNALTAN